ncbi:MAG: metal-dependent transcriptional regulator [Clostridia bacterium]|nr:metal-dependent transcriptional regulator [Clostridia bacterium]MBR5265082.1 metal-dependent transcriptional regulator [Clostridia bacterium]
MKIQESAENYLETIYILRKKMGSVRSIDIVNHLGFSKPSVSNAMKQFRENGYVTVDDGGFITLTDMGLEVAEKIYMRHEVLTKVLTFIGVSEETAKEDACKIEHYLSDETFDAIVKHAQKIAQ